MLPLRLRPAPPGFPALCTAPLFIQLLGSKSRHQFSPHAPHPIHQLATWLCLRYPRSNHQFLPPPRLQFWSQPPRCSPCTAGSPCSSSCFRQPYPIHFPRSSHGSFRKHGADLVIHRLKPSNDTLSRSIKSKPLCMACEVLLLSRFISLPVHLA